MKIIPKIKLLLVVLSAMIFGKINAQVGVNILVPHKSAAMQIEAPTGTAKGLLTPSMTTAQRMSVNTGTNIAADGLIVYDTQHHMHYYYNSASNRWTSMSPLTLSTPIVASSVVPSGVITTPSSSATFSLGINKQNPSQALDVVGNTTVSGNVSIGGNLSATGSVNVNGTLTVPGFPANALVPAGIIVMWSGTTVPLGWGICDGGTYNGLVTPDLRGRFIVGVNNFPGTFNGSGQAVVSGISGQLPAVAPNDGTTTNYGTIGNKGGEIGHTLSLAEMPSHTHNVSGSLTNTNVFGFNGYGNSSVSNGTAFAGDAQTIALSISETSKGSDQIHENRPPYYVLAYIIKLP
jgi:microcystin-dependent protein